MADGRRARRRLMRRRHRGAVAGERAHARNRFRDWPPLEWRAAKGDIWFIGQVEMPTNRMNCWMQEDPPLG